ncbi:MAG: Flp pilus assembly complex ATPase component TadA [Clostridia bacterium]|nr:Flp pilus assembly complex ATPase component TadA [Clostridia bacterium]
MENNTGNEIGPDYVDPSLLSSYEDSPVSKPLTGNSGDANDVLNSIFRQAIDREASDIHFIVGCLPLIRVSKELIFLDTYNEITLEEQRKYINIILKNNNKLVEVLEEQRLLDTNYKYETTRFRVNISFAMDAPTISMRIIKDTLPPYDSLNLPPIIKEYAIKSQGLILVTGKPGTGKSTTMSALVNEINETENKKILMLESPIEYVHTNKRSIIIQKEVSPYGDCKSYQTGVVNSLREDCDVLVVGEIRDKATMDATIEMAETGHLVIGTLHTNSCAETIDRIINFYPTEDQQTVKFMLANALKLVVSQRMIRGGYGNMVMIPEVLVVDEQIGGMIKKEKFNNIEVEDAMQSGREKGNISIVYSLADAVNSGRITMEQAMKEVDFKRQELLTRVVAVGKQRKFY